MRIDPVPTGSTYTPIVSEGNPLFEDQLPPEAPGVESHTPTEVERDEIDHGGGSRNGPTNPARVRGKFAKAARIDHGTSADTTGSAAPAASPENEDASATETESVSEVPDGEQTDSR